MPQRKDSKKRKSRRPRLIVKPRRWRDALNALRSEASFEDLRKIEQLSKPSKFSDEPWVRVKDLVVADKVFQWRDDYSDLQAEERHMRELMRALELDHKLQPIVVIRLGKKLYVVDGHHRLAAYVALGRAQVPVQYFKGGLEEAFLKSLDINIRDKLPMTRRDKYEAAFRLVKHKMQYQHSITWEEIAHRAIVSERLIYKMQATLREHPEAREWSWGQTLGNVVNAKADYQPGGDEFRDEHARKMADQIMSKVKMNLTANPDITALALAMISETLPYALIEEWQDHAMEVFMERAREANKPEVEQALREAFDRLSAAEFEAAAAAL